MKKLYPYLLPVMAGLLSLTACADRNELPDNLIQSPEGLKIRLEWTTGATSEEALQEADLDLRLMRGTEIVGRSENVSRFESLIMHKTLTNGEFLLDVETYKVKKRTDFTVTVSDADNTNNKIYTSYFLPGEKLKIEFLKIKKEGERYTIITL